MRHRKLHWLLLAWAELAGDEGAQVRRWTGALLDDDGAVVRLAQAFTRMGETFSLGGHGFLGDRVPTRIPQVDRAALAKVCDADRLVARVEELRSQGVPGVAEAALERFAVGLRHRTPMDSRDLATGQ